MTNPLIHAYDLLHFRRRPRTPVFRQAEAAECGLACLAMIAAYHGQGTTLAILRRKFTLSLKGVNLTRMIEMAQTMGFTSRAIRLEVDEVVNLQRPCILHWDMDHFVVLCNANKRHAVINDPAYGTRKVDWKTIEKHFTGIALELTPAMRIKRQRPEPPISLRSLAGSIHGLGRTLLQIIGLAAVLELFALLGPQFMQIVVDRVLPNADRDLLTLIGTSFIGLLVLQTLISALRSWIMTWLGTHLNMGWSGNVFQHLLKLPQDYFLKRHLGDIVSRFGAISTIQQTITTQFIGAVLDGLMAGLTLVMLFVYSNLLACVTLASAVVYAMMRLLYFHVYKEANLNQIATTAKQQTSFLEAVRGVQTVRLYNQEAAQTSRYLNVTADALNTSVSIQRLNLIFSSINSFISGLQRIMVLWIGARMAIDGTFSAGMLMAFASYADLFASRTSNLIDYGIQLTLLRLQGERLADIVLSPSERFSEGTYAGTVLKTCITLENVSYRYADGEPWVVRNCSFRVEAGETVAIVGPSGCGKSTLIRLMLGLLDPQIGEIRIGGINLRNLGKQTYRSIVASVMQDDCLFSGTVADNISFFDPGATQVDIERAANLAQLHDDIASMPMGYHTLVGDMGSTLSGGQQQRLHLARALYRKPRILILDEATSHLDLFTESTIQSSLRELNMTTVLIAHRPETTANASRVLLLGENGVSEVMTKRARSSSGGG